MIVDGLRPFALKVKKRRQHSERSGVRWLSTGKRHPGSENQVNSSAGWWSLEFVPRKDRSWDHPPRKPMELNQDHDFWYLVQLGSKSIRETGTFDILWWMFQVTVALPSGRSDTFWIPESSKVGDLRVLAQNSFQLGFLRLVAADHSVVDPTKSLRTAGLTVKMETSWQLLP